MRECSQGEAAACGEAGIPESPHENPKQTLQGGGKDPDSFPLEVGKQNPSTVRNINQLKDLPAVELLPLTKPHLLPSPRGQSPHRVLSLSIRKDPWRAACWNSLPEALTAQLGALRKGPGAREEAGKERWTHSWGNCLLWCHRETNPRLSARG